MDDLEKHTWIPDEKKAKLRELMAEWTGEGRGYVLIIQPPTPEQDGFTIFQPCVEP